MPKALVFGSMNMDLSICCARIPAAGETIDGDSFITNPGGKGANQAVAASRMGAPVTMVAAVGTTRSAPCSSGASMAPASTCRP